MVPQAIGVVDLTGLAPAWRSWRPVGHSRWRAFAWRRWQIIQTGWGWRSSSTSFGGKAAAPEGWYARAAMVVEFSEAANAGGYYIAGMKENNS